MSVKRSHTTADFLEWDIMLSVVRKLFRDGNYRMSLFIGCGAFFGLRVSDLRQLRWKDLISNETFTLTEQKTGKQRTIKINKDFQKHIRACHEALKIDNDGEHCFLSRKRMVFSTQRINIMLKEIKKRYNIKIENFSCHSLRKCFGRKVFESSGENAQMALVKLSELFNHSSIQITKIYLGIRDKELMETYDLLDF